MSSQPFEDVWGIGFLRSDSKSVKTMPPPSPWEAKSPGCKEGGGSGTRMTATTTTTDDDYWRRWRLRQRRCWWWWLGLRWRRRWRPNNNQQCRLVITNPQLYPIKTHISARPWPPRFSLALCTVANSTLNCHHLHLVELWCVYIEASYLAAIVHTAV